MEQEQKPTRTARMKNFFVECRRVLRITKKPSKFEYKTIVKVSALGIAIIGLIGFVVTLIKELIL